MKIETHFLKCANKKPQKWIDDDTVVVLPLHLMTWPAVLDIVIGYVGRDMKSKKERERIWFVFGMMVKNEEQSESIYS